ncbi:MAG: hypothetical protein NZ518_03600, partial [Dehalococcoidia bacterium]|nr:hypothetical protein [Dehalococcoidia bacterium]
VDLGLQPEMAAKATRFFLELARAAQFTVGAGRAEPVDDRADVGRRGAVNADPLAPQGKRVVRLPARGTPMESSAPMVPALAINLPPEALTMSEEELTAFFGRVTRAWRNATA